MVEYELLNPIGIKNGKMVFVGEVENGLKCGCVCVKCNKPLVAKNNPNNVKISHFAHYNSTECNGGYETGLHLLAKEIMNEIDEIKLPRYIPDKSTIDRLVKNNPVTANWFDNWILLENRKDYPFNIVTLKIWNIKNEYTGLKGIRPDSFVETQYGALIIEFVVSHNIDFEKREKIINHNISTIEVYFTNRDIIKSKDELKNIIINETDNKKWIYNKPNKQYESQFLEYAEKVYIENKLIEERERERAREERAREERAREERAREERAREERAREQAKLQPEEQKRKKQQERERRKGERQQEFVKTINNSELMRIVDGWDIYYLEPVQDFLERGKKYQNLFPKKEVLIENNNEQKYLFYNVSREKNRDTKNLSYTDKVFNLLIDLKDREVFNIEKNVREENKKKFYEIVQCFRESEFCTNFDIFMTETYLRKHKKGKWFKLEELKINLPPKPTIINPDKEEPTINSNTDERHNTLRSKQGILF